MKGAPIGEDLNGPLVRVLDAMLDGRGAYLISASDSSIRS